MDLFSAIQFGIYKYTTMDAYRQIGWSDDAFTEDQFSHHANPYELYYILMHFPPHVSPTSVMHVNSSMLDKD